MSGVDRIIAERVRQLGRGFTPEHDANHATDLWDAARCYLVAARFATMFGRAMPVSSRDAEAFWPWDEDSWSPSYDPIRNLEKAGALIAAEIDRLENQCTTPILT